MKIGNLSQPPYETSLMGVVRGVFDHYGIEASTPWLYGASGHAFVANIHTELCPSGPYCWNGDAWSALLANLGIERKAFGFFGPKSTPEQRAGVEEAVRTALDAGVLCSHLNMDNQLITGYDDAGLTSARPWGEDCPVTPGRLTYGTWDEFGDEVHVSFYRYERVEPVDDRTAVRASLAFAVDLYERPNAHTEKMYGIGPDAYVNWIAAVKAGHGGDHGAWWNATVYSECRKMAASYFTEIAEHFPQTADAAHDLSECYATLGQNLERAADREMPAEVKAVLLADTAAAERDAVSRISSLLDTL